jgi:hypothetical protein
MADAPSGGGSNWGAFEVILGLLLLIGLLSSIANKGKIVPVTSVTTPKKETITKLDTSTDRCGLSITAPLSLERVSGAVHLSGVTTGCNWKPDGSTVLFAQVITAAGVPISDFISVQDTGADFLDTAFDTTIAIRTTFTGSGYLILIPATQPEDGKSISVRIPLRFVRN